MNKAWYVHIMECYAAVRRNGDISKELLWSVKLKNNVEESLYTCYHLSEKRGDTNIYTYLNIF